jgi:BirA family transcriptional regulator, biotin operon repressor / biotin---[acetyl-CoA-carboxylase] ligase
MIEETANSTLSLPPAFRPVAATSGDDALATARALAEAGADPGSFVWAPRDDIADCAVVLAPSEPLAPSLRVAYVAMAATGDALGALIPAGIPVAFGWPDRIVVNGAPAGGIRLLAAPTRRQTDVPDWMVAGVTLTLKLPPTGTEPGRAPHRTALELEGCGELTVPEFLESFARHLLYWMNRWEDDGFAPVRLAWLERAAGYGTRNQGMETAGPWADRVLVDLGSDGDVTVQENGKAVTRPLADILDGPTWSP